MKKYIFCFISLVFINTVISLCQSVYLDADFGDSGKVITDFESYDSHGNAIAIQSDSKILVTGYTDYAELSDFILIRYNNNGTIDTTFGENGKVSTDFGSVNEFAESIAIQQDGKIVIAGNTNNFFALARFNTSGEIDSLFGENGKVTTHIEDYGFYQCGSLAIQHDEKILLAGSIGEHGAMVRYNSDGTPDDSFGDEGKVIVDFGNPGDEYLFVSMALQTDAKIVVAGFSFVSDYDFTVLRYNESGTLDSLFGEDGKVTADIINSPDDRATSVAIQQDGKIIVAGWSGVFDVERTDWDFGLVRLNTDGTPDDSFGIDGRILDDLSNYQDDRAESLAIQTDGKILVAGYTYGVGYSNFALVRYNTNGSRDTTFNGNGIIITDIGDSTSDDANALIVQDDGKILIAGTSDNNIAVARYLPELNLSLTDMPNSTSNLLIYPVPVTSDFIIKYTLDSEEFININLYDNTGRIIQNFVNKDKRQKGQNIEILSFNSSLSPGYYILVLNTPVKKVSIKIIKR